MNVKGRLTLERRWAVVRAIAASNRVLAITRPQSESRGLVRGPRWSDAFGPIVNADLAFRIDEDMSRRTF